MGKRRGKPILPTYYETVGAMLKADIQIRASCQKCRNAFDVDLRVLAVLYGIETSLIGRHPPCRLFNCDGKCIFLVSAGAGTPMLPLDRWIDSYGASGSTGK